MFSLQIDIFGVTILQDSDIVSPTPSVQVAVLTWGEGAARSRNGGPWGGWFVNPEMMENRDLENLVTRQEYLKKLTTKRLSLHPPPNQCFAKNHNSIPELF